jgi:uncharacterized membrane protein
MDPKVEHNRRLRGMEDGDGFIDRILRANRLYIQFRFDSDGSVTTEGAWIDDVVLSGQSGETEVTIPSGTIIPNPAAVSQATTVTGTGQVKSRMPNNVVKIAMGYRNSAGAWVGGEPVVGWSSVPGTSWVSWSSGNRTIAAPSTAGTYSLWVLAMDTASDAEVIAAFKARTNTVEDKVNKKLATPTLSVGETEVTIPSGTIIPNPAAVSQATTVTGTGQVKSRMPNNMVKIAMGYRNSAGAWVGGEPVVGWSSVPGTSWVSWSSGNRRLRLRARLGTYSLCGCWRWTRLRTRR